MACPSQTHQKVTCKYIQILSLISNKKYINKEWMTFYVIGTKNKYQITKRTLIYFRE